MIIVSVIICTYNRSHYLKKCITSFLRQNCELKDFEILIIDNNSTDQTVQTFKELATTSQHQLYYFKEENQGLSHARNRGIKEARGKFIAFVDDDAEAEVDYIKNMITIITQHQLVQVFGGKTIPSFESSPPKWLSTYLMPLYAQLNLGNSFKKMKKGQFPVGANMVFKKDILPNNEPFDTDLGRNGESLESGEEKHLFNELRKNNIIPYYAPNCQVKHLIPEKRLSLDYIKKQALGTGKSERLRSKKEREV